MAAVHTGRAPTWTRRTTLRGGAFLGSPVGSWEDAEFLAAERAGAIGYTDTGVTPTGRTARSAG